MRIIFIQISIVFIMLGITFLYFNNDYNTPLNRQLYYLWDKGKDFFFAGSLYCYLKGNLKKIFLLISSCMLLRLLWQIFEIINYDYANRTFFLNWLFLVCCMAILGINLISIYQDKKQFKENGRN
jgi:hypothetical protein